MAMYALKDTTLTALGDAVRNKTTKYITVDEPATKPIALSIDTEIVPVSGNAYRSAIIDLKELCGDVYEQANKIFVKFDYETDRENGFYMYLYWLNSKDYADYSGTTVYAIDNSNYGSHPASNSGSFFRNKLKQYCYFSVIKSNGAIEANRNMKLNIQLWLCDENNKYFKLNTYTPLEMADAINELMIIPDEVLTLTGKCSYRFCYNNSNWLIDNFGDKITTKDISYLENTFNNSTLLVDIPFELNISNKLETIGSCFSFCNQLKTVPYIIGPERTPPTGAYSGTISMSNLFNACYSVREIPNDYFFKIVPNKDYWDKCGEITTQSYSGIFAKCYSLRELPDISMLKGAWTSVYSSFNYNLMNNCYSLNQAVNLPISGSFTSNSFNTTFDNGYRLKDIAFETNEDGTPKTAKWKSQTIDLSKYVGYAQFKDNIIDYNAGITVDKEVKDDATYQALKNDEDWYTTKLDYCRYNHDSAVRTIASLPDCSATGTNTIKFKGAAGALTDGGAINTLTEEEIAVAAAKGWTVSLV